MTTNLYSAKSSTGDELYLEHTDKIGSFLRNGERPQLCHYNLSYRLRHN